MIGWLIENRQRGTERDWAFTRFESWTPYTGREGLKKKLCRAVEPFRFFKSSFEGSYQAAS